MEDAFPLAFSDSENEDLDHDGRTAAQVARAQRIEAARLAAASYSAKIEEPYWFLHSPPRSKAPVPGPDRTELFTLHSLYLSGSYSLALDSALSLLECPQTQAQAQKDDVELTDLALRSALKARREGEERVRRVARRWRERPTHPSLILTCSRVLASPSPPPPPPPPLPSSSSPIADPDSDSQEALLALLLSSPLSRRPHTGQPSPYLAHLSSLLVKRGAGLLDDLLHRRVRLDVDLDLDTEGEEEKKEVERQFERLGLGVGSGSGSGILGVDAGSGHGLVGSRAEAQAAEEERAEAREVLVRLLGLRGGQQQEGEEEEEEQQRDVRSL